MLNLSKKFFSCILIASLLILPGCAGGPSIETYSPIVMMDKGDTDRYEADIKECRQYALQRPGVGKGAAEGAGAGAAGGAIIGGILGSFDGKFGQGALAGAAISAIMGGLKGAAIARTRQKVIVIKCMEKKGWEILSD